MDHSSNGIIKFILISILLHLIICFYPIILLDLSLNKIKPYNHKINDYTVNNVFNYKNLNIKIKQPETNKTSSNLYTQKENNIKIIENIKKQINDTFKYPLAAVNNNISGTATIGITFNNSKNPVAIRIESSSGHKILDDASIQTANFVSLDEPTDGLIYILVPFIFKIE